MCANVPGQAAAPPIDCAATEDVNDGSHDARPCATVVCDSDVLHGAVLRIRCSSFKELAGVGWGTWIPAKTRVADQKLLACSAFSSSRGGRVDALWTITVDHSRRRPAGARGAFNQPFGVDDPTATLGTSYLQAIR
jgi:hypothetical protein